MWGDVEYLYFPDDETAIARALRRVRADSIDECEVEIETLDSGSPKLDQYLEDVLQEEDVYAFSRVCRAIREVDHPKTLAHIIEFTGRTDSESIIILAEHMDLFYVYPEVWDDEKLVCEWMEDHDITCDPELKDYGCAIVGLSSDYTDKTFFDSGRYLVQYVEDQKTTSVLPKSTCYLSYTKRRVVSGAFFCKVFLVFSLDKSDSVCYNKR